MRVESLNPYVLASPPFPYMWFIFEADMYDRAARQSDSIRCSP